MNYSCAILFLIGGSFMENFEKQEYNAPVLEEVEEMVFTKEVWEDFNDGRWCFGCTNCNCN